MLNERETILLPEKLATREQALRLTTLVSSLQPVLDARNVVAASPSFSDELVRILLVERPMVHLRILSAPSALATRLEKAAGIRKVRERLLLDS
jgi:hypothetical protein